MDSGRQKTWSYVHGPFRKKLYVLNTESDSVTVIDTVNLIDIKTIKIGNSSTQVLPNTIFASAKGNKIYVSKADTKYRTYVTIIDSLKDEVTEAVPLPLQKNYSFAFTGNKNSNYVYLACLSMDGSPQDRLFAINIDQDFAYPVGVGMDISFDGFHNPFTVHPDGHTLATFGFYGLLTYFDGYEIGNSRVPMALEQTVSGIYMDNKKLVCTMRDELDYLALIDNLSIHKDGSISYGDFKKIPSYRWQDKIRLSRNQTYVGVTIRPFGDYKSGVQIINIAEENGMNKLVELPFVGDLAFYGDTKAYVGEESSVRPIDVTNGTALPPIDMKAGVANIISGYINQSL